MSKTLPTLYSLLEGIVRQNYFNDHSITNMTLKEHLYPTMPSDEYQTFVNKMSSLLKSIITSDMDFNQLDAFLTSQMKRKESGITEDQAVIFARFWKDHKTNIHRVITTSVCWNDTFAEVDWRIDVKTQSKGKDIINVPTAIVKFHLHHNISKENKFLQFEMDESRLAETLGTFDEIQNQISGSCQQSQ